ncbi:universal stress protein [Nocardioides daeguensis]|uniref:UspA domain-containing protein n=1 Tax=Nocardioides daeguensis TaxID=908359 RepID=A0ABP6UUE6_9ACTN|nr:universal stress protein [Nocardioides daeguensis]MBV6728352.1 universal stress protein [Nocardioides daeguensis]MCR1773161.1 universal stress protein [Nocardioides daeguensis]
MSENPSCIVVGYDGSASADAALAWAASDSATDLRVVLVGTAMDPVLGGYRHVMDRAVEEWRTAATERVAALGRPDATIDVRHGPVVPELLQAAEKASMLVVGSTGHGLAAGTLTGSVSQHVARHAPCPVVVVRPRHSTVVDRIVVGVDDSPESAQALRFACERARRTGEGVTAIHGYFSVLAHVLTFDGAESDVADRQLAAAEKLVRELCRDCAAEFPDVEIEPEAIPVRAGQVLVDASRAASLLVVGSRGRDAFAEMLLGSVSQHVLAHAQCPVAIVR